MDHTVSLQTWKLTDYARYYTRLVENLARPQRLKLAAPRVRKAQFKASQSLDRSWRRLFSIDDARSRPLQTLYAQFMPDYVFDISAELGINHANLMQLGVEIEVHAPGFVVQPEVEYRYEIGVADLLHLSRDRGLLFLDTHVHSPSGEPLLTHRDALFLNKLSERDAAQLQNQPANAELRKPYQGLSKEPRRLNAADVEIAKEVFIGEQNGIEYGGLSGDPNPLHTRRLFSRMLGHPQAFVQGLYMTNVALKHLSAGSPLHSFSMRFARPTYVGCDVRFLARDGRFEFVDNGDKLLAFGAYALGRQQLPAAERDAA